MRYWSDPWNISDERTALEQRSWWHSASYNTRKKMNEFSQKMFVDVLDKIIILKCVMIGLYGMVILIYLCTGRAYDNYCGHCKCLSIRFGQYLFVPKICGN